MNDIITSKLKEIEEKENIKILHCVESGSRAWGFASPDSDYDVRFIYLRPKEFYLRLEKTRDVIEWQLDDTLDINGWDIRKALTLLYSSNPTLFEWDASPIVYQTTDEWARISEVVHRYFVPQSGLYHYLNTAKRNYTASFKGETVRFKKYFYVLRPLLACEWILAEGTPPPIVFRKLTERFPNKEIAEDVEKLLHIKMNTPEIGEGKRFERIDAYIEQSFVDIEEKIKHLPTAHGNGWHDLNALFLSLIE
ncbi:MAG: nucleotidyltransferase domain-containing protein [Ruminococcaceae bacterium]|nr:nucleotidyltransferase domain-containing protein [Oscillospiraceae bacterium]